MRPSVRFLLGFFVAHCLLTSAAGLAQTLSASKLSAHLINGYTLGGSNIVAGRPRTLKVLGLDSGWPAGMVLAMRDYKAKAPGGKLVARIYSPKNYSLTDEPTASAADFWSTILQPGLNSLSPSDRGLIDYLEGPNEGQTPTLGYPNSSSGQGLQSSQWFNEFWTNLTPLIVAAGYRPCIGSIAVGNPGGTQAEMQSYLAAFIPALRQAKAAGGAWSYHSYTIGYTTDTSAELWYSLRYRQFYSYFAVSFPDLNGLPLILTEGGVDLDGNPATSGWQARGTASDYEHWLNWFDQQMQQDPYVVGCTIFEIGNPESWGWPSFDLEPVAGWLENYLLGPAALPPVPAGLTATAANRSVTLCWTDVPVTPTAWNVKRATNSGGPYYVIATNVATGVTAPAFTDASVLNNHTYFYVVTAANALGESHNSAEVSATPLPPTYAAFDCGGSGSGGFQADGYFNAGTSYSVGNAIDTSGLVNPAPMTVYQSQRYGNVAYSFAFLAPNTCYKVRLHFAEIYWSSIGQRVFNVLLNGVQVLGNFDIIGAAGAAFRGNIQEFNAISDSTGNLSLQLVTVTDNASINGIELLLNAPTGIPAAPTNLRTGVANSLITLNWSVPDGASGFTVRRATASGGPYTVIATNLTQAAWRDASFVPNTTYYYVVSAANSYGESPNSAEASARSATGLPDLVVTSVGWSPAGLYNSLHAVFSARVMNRGSAATPGGKIGVAFFVDGNEVSWCGNYSAVLPANSAVTLLADGGPSGVNYWTATAGPHQVTALVDDVGLITESIEDNNATTTPLSVFSSGYAFNSGGATVGAFAADAHFAGSLNTYSATNAIDLSGTATPAPAAAYQSERWGDFAYVFDNLSPGSNYTVRVHLAEISPAVDLPGERQFNIAVNGITVFTNLDVLARAGARFRALTLDVKKRADASGTLAVWFTRGAANEAKCSAIQVFGSAPATQPPTLSGITVAAVITLTWQSSPAVIYQVQSCSDLALTDWTNVGTPLVASTTSMSATDASPLTTRRFYRIVQIN